MIAHEMGRSGGFTHSHPGAHIVHPPGGTGPEYSTPAARGKKGLAQSVVEFRGKYEHTVDDRGRVSIPARYRNEFTGKIILTMSVDGCIEVYTEDGFNQVASHVAVEPPTTPEGRRARRAFYSESFDTELDRQGRILIPPRLRQMAAVNGTVIITGRKECLEIWNPERLEEIMSAAAATSTEQAPEV